MRESRHTLDVIGFKGTLLLCCKVFHCIMFCSTYKKELHHVHNCLVHKNSVQSLLLSFVNTTDVCRFILISRKLLLLTVNKLTISKLLWGDLI